MNRFLSILTHILFWFLALSFLVSCGGDEPIDPTPVTPVTPVNPPTPEKDTTAPTITVAKASVNIISGPSITISGNELKIGNDVVASWKDDKSTSCTVSITFVAAEGTSKTVNSGDKLNEEGKLKVKVSDEAGNSSEAEISLTAIAVYGLEILQSKTLQIDQEVNLLEGLTFADGLTLQKVELEQDGSRSEIANPEAFNPQFPDSINIILTLSRTDGSTIEVRVDNLTVQGIQYQSLSITNLKPVDILPKIGQIEYGDRKAYDHVEHLRIAETTRIIDMMWTYGTNNHSVEEYQGLMGRLNTGVETEVPIGYPEGYDFIEYIGDPSTVAWPPGYASHPASHGHSMWYILLTWVKHAHFIMRWDDIYGKKFSDYLKNHPNSIFIFSHSMGAGWPKESYENYKKMQKYEEEIELYDQENYLLFQAVGNLKIASREDGTQYVKNRVYNEEYEGYFDEHWVYDIAVSMANSIKNHRPHSHLMIAVGTNKNGDIDQTNANVESSKFPIGFADNVLFSWRPVFAKEEPDGMLIWWSGKYPSSPCAPWAAAMSCLCFQMYAEIANVDQLLEMIRATCLTDYIRLDGMNQPLQLINPGGFFKKYCMPSSPPTSIGTDETINLEKGYYKGVVFNIPGGEVKIGDEWISFDAKNKDLILAQNPMNLEWRLNGNLLRKYGYTPGQTLQGQIITVDDQWNGLRLEVPMSITIR